MPIKSHDLIATRYPKVRVFVRVLISEENKTMKVVVAKRIPGEADVRRFRDLALRRDQKRP
jgi:hypothetical protein